MTTLKTGEGEKQVPQNLFRREADTKARRATQNVQNKRTGSSEIDVANLPNQRRQKKVRRVTKR